MIAFRSSPFSFPATNCILIVLIAPCRRCDDINYSTTWKLFSFLFSPSFPLFSQPLAKDTLPFVSSHPVRLVGVIHQNRPDRPSVRLVASLLVYSLPWTQSSWQFKN